MNKWFFINFFILLFSIWKIVTGNITTYTIAAGIGITLILYNWTRHAMYSTIRSNISRKRKITYAKIFKKLNPIHKWTGTTALLFIGIHAATIIYYFNFQLKNLKMISGTLAIINLLFVVIFGWLRFIRTTVTRRYIHWTLAYTLIFLVILHLLL